jgi:trehalose utilization protein
VVLVWSERSAPTDVYPNDINTVVADGLRAMLPAGWEVRLANLDEPEQGLSAAALNAADVLVWWAHIRDEEVSDAASNRIVQRVVNDGMGFVPLHSGTWGSKPFVQMTGTGGYWTDARLLNESNTILVAAPDHPVARGLSNFTIPVEERYAGMFDAPPGTLVLDGIYNSDGTRGAQGVAWTFGQGRVFYFRPGHETYPVYFQTEVRQVIRNAVLWAAKDEAAI